MGVVKVFAHAQWCPTSSIALAMPLLALYNLFVGAGHGYGYTSGMIHKSMAGYPDHSLRYSQAPTVEGTFMLCYSVLFLFGKINDNVVYH